MKRNFFYCILLLGALMGSCKPGENGTEVEIDPRDQYIGSYTGGYTGQTTSGPFPLNIFSGPAVIEVTKAPAVKEMLITITYNKGIQFENSEKLTAELVDNKFTIIDKTKEPVTVGPTTYELPYKATGEFTIKNEFVMVTSAEIVRDGTTLKKVASVTGAKKVN